MSRKIKLIFNPIANLGRAQELAGPLRAIVSNNGSGEWIETGYHHHATELARQAAEAGCDLVIALGGDGTVHEVMNGLMQAQVARRPSLGVVPIGSGNDFSFVMGMPTDPTAALQQVMAGKPRQVDIGQVQTRDGHTEYFTNALGIGFDTLVTIHSRKIPIVKGFAIYLAAVLQTIFFDYRKFHLKVNMDGQAWEDTLHMLVLCNGKREGGGFLVAPEGDPADGIFEFSAVRKISRLRMLQTLPYFIKGTQNSLRHVSSGRFHTMEIQSDQPLPLHADGEILDDPGLETDWLSIKILPGALEVIT